ncbi:hypothetical protein CRM94_17120 [Burkholderia gladioli]|uniref:N-terminal domain-containing protein n=1 Tax=Burkholderia gladioli TaxID=28095 RepID=A0A2A7SAL8_BURGA|nr:ArdC family protein [Burkholderia gladioli]PEH40439.1 hypothetical protein CRM94_17120 [Burkholderia gladioli]
MGIRTSNSIPSARRTRASDAQHSAQSDEPKVSRHRQCLDAVSAANTWLATRAPMQSPWAGLPGLPRKVADGEHYAGTNAIILMAAQDTLGYRSVLWGSFKALKDKDLKLTKGSRNTTAIFGGYIERRSKSDIRNTGLDSVSAPANDNASSKIAQDDGKEDAEKRSRVPTLQPVQLFNVAQCHGFLSDPSTQALPEHLASVHRQWLACSTEAVVQFARWDEEHPGVELNAEEVALIVRLATDFAVLRRTNAPEAISEPLPTVPDMGARFMKVCGVSWELSSEVADKIFGEEKSVQVSAQKTARESVSEVAAVSPATASVSLPAEAIGGAPLADPSEQNGQATLPVIDAMDDASMEIPDWIGVW